MQSQRRGLPFGQPPFFAFFLLAATLAGLLDFPPSLPSSEYHLRTAGGGVGFVLIFWRCLGRVSVFGAEVEPSTEDRQFNFAAWSILAFQQNCNDWRGSVARPAHGPQLDFVVALAVPNFDPEGNTVGALPR